jgi:hypothetical protein
MAQQLMVMKRYGIGGLRVSGVSLIRRCGRIVEWHATHTRDQRGGRTMPKSMLQIAIPNKRRRLGMKHTKPVGLSLLLAVCLLVGGGPAAATNMFDPGPVVNCTSVNCGSRIIGGTVLRSSDFPLPWVTQIAARQGECLRIDVIEQGADLEAVLISPSGMVWINNNGVAGGQGPVIRINGIPQNGWFTLQLSHQTGLPVDTDFTLAFGRYPFNNNANCLPVVEAVLEDTEDTTE